MNLHTVLFIVIVVYSAQVFGGNLDKYYGYNEPDCLSNGGICILKSQCKPSQLSEKSGLCPKQRSEGFECCHGVPKDENRCKKLGGECFEKNYCKNPITRAKDCNADQDCCLLV